jgi:hypothetical protein
MAIKQMRTDDQELAISEVRKILETNLPNLMPNDQTFATSLLNQLDARGLTDKQLFWFCKLAERSTNPGEERAKTQIGELKGVMTLFAFAAQHVISPTIIIAVEVENDIHQYRLSVAGDRARVPGSINVVENGGDRIWFGRVLQSGDFEESPRVDVPKDLIPALKRFAADPGGFATESAKLTGRCCFCRKPIGEGDDPRSIARGYGPICASNFGLPWG